jgi:uncharacterized protein YidB (DUF937 family)
VSFLTDVIGAALSEHSTPQARSAGPSPLAGALLSLLAPKSTNAGAPPEQAQLETDALRQLLARFEQSGYGDIVRSWIGNGPNQPVEPHQVGAALGPGKVSDLANDTGLPRETLLQELSRLIPTVIDRLTPQGKVPESAPPPGRPPSSTAV